MKMTREEFNVTRLAMLEAVGVVGTMSEKYPSNWNLNTSYEKAINSLDYIDEIGLHLGFLDENFNETNEEEYTEAEFEKAALEAGIPLSVIRGETNLTDHFSQEYIDFKRGKKV